MSIESAIRTHLLSKPALTALVVNRVYSEIAPETASYPFVTFQVIAEDHDHHMGGAAGLALVSLQLDCWAETKAGAIALSEVVRNLLDGYTGEMGTEALPVRMCHLTNRTDLNQGEGEGAQRPIFRKSMDFQIWHVESVPTL